MPHSPIHSHTLCTFFYTNGCIGRQSGVQRLAQGCFNMWPREARRQTTNLPIGTTALTPELQSLQWCPLSVLSHILKHSLLINKHPSILYTCLIQQSVTGGWSLSQLSLTIRQGTPWTGHQSITGPHRNKQPCTLTLSPKVNLETPINLTHVFGSLIIKHALHYNLFRTLRRERLQW